MLEIIESENTDYSMIYENNIGKTIIKYRKLQQNAHTAISFENKEIIAIYIISINMN